MNSLKKRSVLLLLAVLCIYLHSSVGQSSTSEVTPASGCGGPTFPCSLRQTNAQLTVVPLAAPTPDMGNLMGAGKRWIAPTYGNTIVRCTDVNSDPGNTAYYSYEVTDNGGSNEQIWNTNGTMLRIMDASTGSSRIYGFDAATGQCTTANQNSRAPAGAVWSPTNPNVDYTLNGTTVVRRTFDYTQPLNAPTSVTVFDVHSCPGLSALKPTWSASLTLNEGGNTFVTAFSDRGGQDTGEYVVAFQTSRGCQVWNTLKGTVTAEGFGQSGKISTFLSVDCSQCDRGTGRSGGRI